ncbi:hypothetical protein [Rothia sp. (in: high G+C Gram-positive bacteria)]|uniref:hypothetical protein n=1 Tax=Rothia sp. (in: high G+C Gram-positive bacteria) TaxID=1885016 RepID=UPI003216F2C4
MEKSTTTQHYLSTLEAAEHLGITRQQFTRRRPPTPVVMVGKTPGWTKEVLDEWDAGLRKIPGRVPGSKHPKKEEG